MLIKDLRKRCGFTQKELGAHLGVCQNTVSAWETGKGFPSCECLIKLSELFGCTIDELVKGDGHE